MKSMMNELIRAYDRAARGYDLMNQLYFCGRDRFFRRLLVSLLVPYRNVLNLCCGTGLDFHPLLDYCSEPGRIVGIDLSVQMLRRAKRKRLPEVSLVRGDIAYLPFRCEVFQAILASFCLTITPTPDASIAEARRVLQSRGKIGVLRARACELLRYFKSAYTKTLRFQ
jgi:demethylmenaquinone methyltransferase/2-methoxy-6-polyprenyl-1,4-benzoquinol methylase